MNFINQRLVRCFSSTYPCNLDHAVWDCMGSLSMCEEENPDSTGVVQ